MKKRFSEEQIIGFLWEAETGLPVKDLCCRYGFPEASYYLWKSKFGGLTVSDAKKLKQLETENARLKKLLAQTLLEGNCRLRRHICLHPTRMGIQFIPLAVKSKYWQEKRTGG